MEGVVATPAVAVAAAASNDHVQGGAVVLVGHPGTVPAERLAQGTVVEPGAVVADAHLDPPAAVVAVVPHAHLAGQGRRHRALVEGGVAGGVVDVQCDEVLGLEGALGHAASTVGCAQPGEPGGVAGDGCRCVEGGERLRWGLRERQPGADTQHSEHAQGGPGSAASQVGQFHSSVLSTGPTPIGVSSVASRRPGCRRGRR